MSRKTLAFLAFGLVALTSARTDAAFQPALALASPVTAGSAPYSQTLGFEFKANVPITLNQLGVYQTTTGPSVVGQQVELVDVTTGNTVLYTTTISGPTQAGAFNYVNIPLIGIGTSDTYEVVSFFATGSTNQYGFGTVAATADLTYINSGYNIGSTINPNLSLFGGIIATNFEYQPSSVLVPEPASFAMFGLGLAGVLVVRRRMTKATA